MGRYRIFLISLFILLFNTNSYSQEIGSERIWADHEIGTVRFNTRLRHATGYNFTPTVDGKIVSLGGNFNGNYQVKLFNRTSGELLAETYIQSNNQWVYEDIAPISLQAGSQYTVAAYITGAGGSLISNRAVNFPLTHGNIQIDGRTFLFLRNNFEARPRNNSLKNIVYGRADAVFIPAGDVFDDSSSEGGEDNQGDTSNENLEHKINLSHDFVIQRNGSIGDDIIWHIEKNGQQALQRNASNELKYLYFSNTTGSNIRVWLLKQLDDGSLQRVSNILEYSPGTSDLFELNLSYSFELSRSGSIGNNITWVIERDGQIVLRRNASNELKYTYFANHPSSNFRVWLIQLINNEYRTVSNTIEYEVGQSAFDISVDTLFNLYRNGQLGNQVQWVIEKDGEIVLEREAEDELSYQYFNNAPGSSFRVWLQRFIGGQFETVSNIVTYEVPDSYPYSLEIDPNYQINRSGNLGESVTLVFVENGTIIFSRNMSNDLSYTYFRNFSGRTFSVYLTRSIGGSNQQVSNTINYSIP